jgi:hypothetical protein
MGDGSLYNVTSIDGLDSLPDLTIGMAPKPRRHGSWLGGKLAQKRVISIGFEILGDPKDDYRTTKPKNALLKAMQLMDSELPLLFDMDYGEDEVMVYASVTALDLPLTNNYSRLRRGVLEFTCTDPMKYAPAQKTGQATTPVVPVAAPYGQAYGFAYSITTGLSGTFRATNDGNSNSPVVYTIIGPVTQPRITLTDKTGVRSTMFNLTLKAKDRLVIDTAKNSAMRNGASMFGTASGALIPDLVMRPGTTTVAFTGDDTGGATPPSLNANWRDASR